MKVQLFFRLVLLSEYVTIVMLSEGWGNLYMYTLKRGGESLHPVENSLLHFPAFWFDKILQMFGVH